MVPLLDTHQHLVFPERMTYAWAERVPALAGRTFGLDDYKALIEGAGIAGTIFMEVDVSSDYRAEARMVSELAARPGSGVLGMIASCRPETDDGFGAWLDEGPSLGVVGYRRILHEVPDDVSQSDTFRANVRRIGSRGLVFDLVFLARQLPIARALAEACPDTAFVLDHCGVPDIAGGGLDPWRMEITKLAALPNLAAKISGVMAYCAPGKARLAEVRPYIEHVLDAFGPDRCLWGSDSHIVNVRASLSEWIAATRAILDTLAPNEAAAVAHRTAERVYGVRLPA